MRLWHKDLIHVLPRQQLLGQWRECCLIAKNIAEKGSPNHILVNRITDYPIDHFISYCSMVLEEMKRRGYKANPDLCFDWLPLAGTKTIPDRALFPDWHNDRYLRQCYYNLQEKYDCGGITAKEWEKINARCYELRRGNISDCLYELKRIWVGKRISYQGEEHTVLDVDYNGMLMIDKPARFTATTAVEINQVKEV